MIVHTPALSKVPGTCSHHRPRGRAVPRGGERTAGAVPRGGERTAGCPTWRGADDGLSHVAGCPTWQGADDRLSHVAGCPTWQGADGRLSHVAGCPTWPGADDGLSHVVGSGRQGLRRAPAVSVPLGWPPATWQTAHHPHTTWGLTPGANTHSTMQVGP